MKTLKFEPDKTNYETLIEEKNAKENASKDSQSTTYDNHNFRSRLEARWAVFFNICNADWEYENEWFECKKNGETVRYLPDFKIHDVVGVEGGELYVEVKGHMSDYDAKKINYFVESGLSKDGKLITTPLLVVGQIPYGRNLDQIINNMYLKGNDESHSKWPKEFNFKTINGDDIALYPGRNVRGRFELFRDEYNSVRRMNKVMTEFAYRYAGTSRFDRLPGPSTKTEMILGEWH